ncbi:protein EARLY RESPONSIVE TO DEHYDRATION 15-like [Silene latifolia]|uniref:protein EARLY RESPONSIVE TO DEHYDRATION 15-like n=1 Tax=Silene latifolia TaxID=37657 RepID=UPI003D7848C6
MGVIHYNQAESPPSKLNPNAPIFIPMKSYLTVEDFSDEWWDLVHSSPFFRDYWLQDCYDDDSTPTFPDDDDFALPDFDDFFDSYLPNQEPQEVEEEKEKIEKELISLAALKWSKSSAKAEPRSFEKVPKIVKNVRVNPRTIHQPR